MGVYIDVNKENYMKALFTDLEKTAKMVSMKDTAKLIHDFVVGNPTNDKEDRVVLDNGLTLVDGKILIKARGLLKK